MRYQSTQKAFQGCHMGLINHKENQLIAVLLVFVPTLRFLNLVQIIFENKKKTPNNTDI